MGVRVICQACPDAHTLTWADERFGCTQSDGRRHVSFGVKILHERSYGYRPDLARFSNDPEATVSGPRSLQKLIDTRKARDGWVDTGLKMDDLEREIKDDIDITPKQSQEIWDRSLKKALNAPPETPVEKKAKRDKLDRLKNQRS